MTSARRDPPEEPSEAAPGSPFREISIELLVHDLKSPISVVEAAVRPLLEKRERYGVLSDRQERSLKRALRGVLKTRRMLHDLLELARADAEEFSILRFRFRDVLLPAVLESFEVVEAERSSRLPEDDALALLALEKEGVLVDLGPGIDSLEMEQDATKLEQILGNLLRNGVQFRRKALRIHAELVDGIVTVEVEDDGPGIEPQERETVFRRYARVGTGESGSESGHGLGLAGARALARSLGGEVSVEDASKGGALFRLEIPVAFEGGRMADDKEAPSGS